MSCPSQVELAAHADGELAPGEAGRTEAHLASCPRCRALFEELRAENRLLARVLDETARAAPARSAARSELVTAGLVVLAAAAGIQALVGWLGELGQETPVTLVDRRSLVVTLLIETFFFLLRQGASMLTSQLATFGLAVLFLLSVIAAFAWRRRWTAGAMLLVALVFGAAPAFALERRVAHHGERDHILVPAGETVDDSLFAAGETVSVEGTVTGNLIAFARKVTVRGTVKGDLVTGAQRIEIDGAVEGNVLTFSEVVTVRGLVGRSLHSFAQHVELGSEGRVEGDAITFAAETDLGGRVGRDLLAFSGLTDLRGEVGRNLSARTGRLRVLGGARIGGNLTARVDNKEHVVVDPQATVAGKIETHLEEEKARKSRFARPGFYLWKAIWLAAAFVTGLVTRRILPWLFVTRLADAGSLGKTLGVGFLALVAPPVAICVVGFTMVGLPLALFALGLWMAALYLSSILVGALVGRTLLSRGEGAPPSFAAGLVVGLAILTVIVSIPYLGSLLHVLVLSLGLGIAAIQAWRILRPVPAV